MTSAVECSPGLVRIVSQPELYVESMTRISKGDQFAICDTDGNVLGYREKQGLGVNLVKPGRPFVLRIVDPNGRRLLTIRRPFFILHSRFEVLIPNDAGGKDILIGGGQLVEIHFKRSYNLYLKGNDAHPFARNRIAVTALSNPILADSGAVVASIHRQTIHKEKPKPNEICSPSSTYGIIMNSPVGMDSKFEPSLSLEQRTVLLALSIVLDIDYYSKDNRVRNNPINFAPGNMFGAGIDFS